MKRVLKWILYGPFYDDNKRTTAECIRRREASTLPAIRENPKLKAMERGMKILDVMILWTWRFVTASVVVAIVLISLGI